MCKHNRGHETNIVGSCTGRSDYLCAKCPMLGPRVHIETLAFHKLSTAGGYRFQKRERLAHSTLKCHTSRYIMWSSSYKSLDSGPMNSTSTRGNKGIDSCTCSAGFFNDKTAGGVHCVSLPPRFHFDTQCESGSIHKHISKVRFSFLCCLHQTCECDMRHERHDSHVAGLNAT